MGAPYRPRDIWRVCGNSIHDECTCRPFGPSTTEVADALARLDTPIDEAA